ncbi:MAG: GIY-YIG nuclease family protein, partial [Chloroflexi bacterium]|nr:GIY-YIG nuclease family protein [Chloroflexota bacterium]
AVVESDGVGAIPYTGIIRMRPRDSRLHAPFIRYLLEGPEFQEQAEMVGVGSVIRHFGPMHLRQMTVRLPPPDEQRAIAYILGTLDDKIELNRRMSETLEQMARAIFKAWFVDFLPVRAKMAAKANDPSLLLPQAEAGTWYVYAIECNDGSLYIGQTEDLRQRWLQHVGGKGASWTKTHPPVNVPYWEKQPSREAAVERENWLKTGYGRKWLKKEIAARTQTGEPVRAKMEGRLSASAGQAGWRRGESLSLPAPPACAEHADRQSEAARQAGGLPAPACAEASAGRHLYDLFPDRLVDSELGEIPVGWEVTTLPDVVEINPRRSLAKGETAPYLDMANMPTRGHVPDAVVDRPFRSGMRFINGDTLVARITPCLENGKTAFVDFLKEGQVGWGSTEYIVLRPKPPLPEEFAYCLARTEAFRDFAIQSMTGTSGRQRVQAESLTHFKLPKVPESVALAFGRAIKPLFARSSAAIHECRTLAALRDALLPKLISGELRVKDAERFLERRGL